MSSQAKAASMRTFFSNRFVQAIMLSGLFLHAGIWVRNFAILMYVTDKTNNDPYAVSLISVAEFLPIFLFSFIGGTFADRWRPKRTMIACDLLSALSVFAVLLTMMMGSWRAVFFATFVSAILSQFSQPSGMKLFKLHVPGEQMQMGMSLYQTMAAVFMIIGPMLGTMVYFRFGIDVAIAIMGVCFLASAGALFFLPEDRTETRKEPQHILQEMKLGFRYVLSNRLLVSLGGNFLAAGLAVGLLNPLGIFLITETLGLSKDKLQWFMMVNGVAMIMGGALALALAKKVKPLSLVMIGILANAVAIAVFGVSANLWVLLGAQFFSGLFIPAIQIANNTMILQNTEDAYVGRVNGTMNPLFMGAMVLTMSSAGALKELVSLSNVYLISAFLFLLGACALIPAYQWQKAGSASAGDNA